MRNAGMMHKTRSGRDLEYHLHLGLRSLYSCQKGDNKKTWLHLLKKIIQVAEHLPYVKSTHRHTAKRNLPQSYMSVYIRISHRLQPFCRREDPSVYTIAMQFYL